MSSGSSVEPRLNAETRVSPGEPDLAELPRLLAASGLFDPPWYRSTYPEAAGHDALAYFLESGWKAGHDPGPGFDSAYYLAANPDVAAAGVNPVSHYLRHGRDEGRSPRPAASARPPGNDEGDAGELAASGLFDPDWYRSTYPEAAGHDGLTYFLETGWKAGHDPGPAFDTAYYLTANPDVAEAGLNPVLHYLRYGHSEGRLPKFFPRGREAAAAPDEFQPLLARFQLDAQEALRVIAANPGGRGWPKLRPGSGVVVCVHSAGNIFMREIAELLAAGFAAAGFATRLCDERIALDGTDAAGRSACGDTRVIVAPHEFFRVASNGRVVPAEWGAGAILLNVEQLHTSWFRQGLAALEQASAILDINLQSAAVLAERGFPAAWLPLGHVADVPRFALQQTLPDLPALRTLEQSVREGCPAPDAPVSERPIDIFLIGYLSPRRAGILERLAERLARWRCHFVLTDADQPQVSGRTAVLESEATIGLAQRSKIVLNLHQSDTLFFEWHRIVLQGIWQRALVISEPLAVQPSFCAGTHFLEAPVDELADLIDWVLGTEAGLRTAERVRTGAYAHLVGQVRLDETLRDLFLSGPVPGAAESLP